MFAGGRPRLSVFLGTGSTGYDTYLILGAGLGYFLVNGLEVGFDYEAWIFADPVMHRISPETRYVFWMVPTIKPYIGFFYRHTFVSDYDDLDHLGGRAGIYFVPPAGHFYFGGGAVYEHELDCEDGYYVDCDNFYPEIALGATF